MSSGQFKKGETPWNKGLKNVNGVSNTRFKTGPEHEGEKHPSWNGGVQNMKKDCAHVWDGKGKRKRRPRMIYEEAYGEIPKGHIIIHLDGDKNNDNLMNLEAISRAELLRRNRLKRKQL